MRCIVRKFLITILIIAVIIVGFCGIMLYEFNKIENETIAGVEQYTTREELENLLTDKKDFFDELVAEFDIVNNIDNIGYI